MMVVGPEEAGRMSLWTYQALLHNWNAAHGGEDGAKPLDPEKADRLKRAMAAHSIH
jgi:hypothetical protein